MRVESGLDFAQNFIETSAAVKIIGKLLGTKAESTAVEISGTAASPEGSELIGNSIARTEVTAIPGTVMGDGLVLTLADVGIPDFTSAFTSELFSLAT